MIEEAGREGPSWRTCASISKRLIDEKRDRAEHVKPSGPKTRFAGTKVNQE